MENAGHACYQVTFLSSELLNSAESSVKCYQVTFLPSQLPSNADSKMLVMLAARSLFCLHNCQVTAESTMLVMLATRSFSCLQTCQVMQKVRCWSCLLPGCFLAFRVAKCCEQTLSTALSLSVFVRESSALEALCGCTACQCDGCFGCNKQCMRQPSDKQLHARKSSVS